METNRTSLIASDYILALIKIYKKHKKDTTYLDKLNEKYLTSLCFTAPEVKSMCDDRSKFEAYEYICMDKTGSNKKLDKELTEFFKKHT